MSPCGFKCLCLHPFERIIRLKLPCTVQASSSDDERTPSGQYEGLNASTTHGYDASSYLRVQASQPKSRAEENRLDDDLAMLHAEGVASSAPNGDASAARLTKSTSMHRS